MDSQPSVFDPSSSRVPEPTSHRRFAKFRNTIMAGLTVIAPVWVTVWVLYTLFKWADSFSAPLIRQLAYGLGYPNVHIPGLGFLLTFSILWIVGTIAANVVGRRLLQNARKAIERLPVVRTIYAPVHQLMETLTSPQRVGFKKVVLVEFPRQGVWSLGFLAGDVPREQGMEPAHSVFVPKAPNPTNGFLLIVTPEQMRHTSLSIEAALRMIVSAGTVVPSTLTLSELPDEQKAVPVFGSTG